MLDSSTQISNNTNFLDRSTRSRVDFKLPSTFRSMEETIKFPNPSVRHHALVTRLREAQDLYIKVIRHRGHNLILDSAFLCDYIERKCHDTKLKKSLIFEAKRIMSIDEKRLFRTFSRLQGISPGDLSFCGIRVMGHIITHIEDPSRLKHCFGLANAIFLASVQLSVPLWNMTNTMMQEQRSKVLTLECAKGELYVSLSGRKYYSRKGRHTLNYMHRHKTKKNAEWHLLKHYLTVIPHYEEEKHYVKAIKTSINGLFNEKMNQEQLEDVPGPFFFPIFNRFTQSKLDQVFRTDKKKRVQFYFNLIQSKTLCAPVGEDMILEQYEKHKDSLCRPVDDPSHIQPNGMDKELYFYGKAFGEVVKKFYNPYKTVIPNQKSTIESTTQDGGSKAYLDGSRNCYSGPLSAKSSCQGSVRQEPFVIGLFGSPGCGKSTTVRNLIQFLHQEYFPEEDFENISYNRCCTLEHWDGYKGQPITVLDDFGQMKDGSDVGEFMNLISTNQYQLPMSEIGQGDGYKGQTFVSPFVIVTTNLSWGSSLHDGSNKPRIEDPFAVWRRFNIPLLLQRESCPSDSFSPVRTSFSRYSISPSSSDKGRWDRKNHVHVTDDGINQCRNVDHMFHSEYIRKRELSGQVGSSGLLLLSHSFGDILPIVKEEYREHRNYHESFLSSTWTQEVECVRITHKPDSSEPSLIVQRIGTAVSQSDKTLSYSFPTQPPSTPPVVEAIALSEPLKVRMITKAEAHTKCLKPLQMAMFEALATYPQFCLTNGCSKNILWDDFEKDGLPWIERIEGCIQSIQSRKEDDELWLSGDYTAATDNFPMWATKALMEGILSNIDHEPTKDWARWEISNHTIRYPKDIPDGTQTSGQLMGSLVSFPLLCLLNDFIVSRSGFSLGKYMINGDDVVACGPRHVVDKWREDAPKVGLSLSIGKNFIDKDFCTVNSQLFYQGQVQHTGKISLLQRKNASIGYSFQEAQYYYGNNPQIRNEFIRQNIHVLRKTPRSLRVSSKIGGLGLYSDLNDDLYGEKPLDKRLVRRVFLYDYLRKYSQVIPVEGFPDLVSISVPEFWNGVDDVGEDVVGRSINLLNTFKSNPPKKENSGDLSHKDLLKWEQRFREIVTPEMKSWYNEFIQGFPIESLPNLDDFQSRTIIVNRYQSKSIRLTCLELAWQCLFAYAEDLPSFFKTDSEVVDHACGNLDDATVNLTPLFSDEDIGIQIEEANGVSHVTLASPLEDYEDIYDDVLSYRDALTENLSTWKWRDYSELDAKFDEYVRSPLWKNVHTGSLTTIQPMHARLFSRFLSKSGMDLPDPMEMLRVIKQKHSSDKDNNGCV